jgi:hypothetical protein
MSGWGLVKRLIVAVVVLAVIVVMALRGCPRMRRSAGIANDTAMAVVSDSAGGLCRSSFYSVKDISRVKNSSPDFVVCRLSLKDSPDFPSSSA